MSETCDNLALACNMCNLHKGPNVGGIDTSTGQLVRLFNPRTDVWAEHFGRRDAEIAGLTGVGRVSVHTAPEKGARVPGEVVQALAPPARQAAPPVILERSEGSQTSSRVDGSVPEDRRDPFAPLRACELFGGMGTSPRCSGPDTGW
ncbi:MAG: hypothetical protein AVDCRST_MAG64-2136 [uncultured Phycisphaerae bacterium]|uniref:HNH domain-containing protein n=1 Tax=uncultured Phycisphaerae bacterium TaxID=904963 RepID=A0A6J4PDY3_9BACT|nr:MAG: hypothetical protein AVDCRST_MAG64-2136 [uncultured Phycisphaerae bacterium]